MEQPPTAHFACRQGEKHGGSSQVPRAEEEPGFSCETQSPFMRLVRGRKGEGRRRS